MTFLSTVEAAQRAGMTVGQFHGHARRRHITPARRIDSARGALYWHPADVDQLVARIDAQAAVAWTPEITVRSTQLRQRETLRQEAA